MSASRKTAKAIPGPAQPEIDAYRGQHLALGRQRIAGEFGVVDVTVDEGESPLAWLARRRARDGSAYVEPHQFQAGERLRADFTRANLMPRTTSNWAKPVARARGGGDTIAHVAEATIAARQRVHQALDAVGPEFAGLLLDICCFLKGLEDVERERRWPARAAKVVLQLALERLARHYGYARETRGRTRADLRMWLAEDAKLGIDGG